jgi:hypothetical protein
VTTLDRTRRVFRTARTTLGHLTGLAECSVQRGLHLTGLAECSVQRGLHLTGLAECSVQRRLHLTGLAECSVQRDFRVTFNSNGTRTMSEFGQEVSDCCSDGH